uniref:Endonuclease/exonuclease/phosphatase domain-containing protein n=1 Tax=Kalanchoe fedtschenkoi TaxID=63787 RepID=A0A7N0VBW2_KALFE
MKAISWNIRGLGRSEKRLALRKLIQDHSPSLLLIQETKTASMNAEIIQSFWGQSSISWASSDSIGRAGTLKVGNIRCVIANIFAPNSECQRRSFWDFLHSKWVKFGYPWMAGGDFNSVLRMEERRGLDSVNPATRCHFDSICQWGKKNTFYDRNPKSSGFKKEIEILNFTI